MMSLLNYLIKGFIGIFGIITVLVAIIPWGLTMLFVYLDELTDK